MRGPHRLTVIGFFLTLGLIEVAAVSRPVLCFPLTSSLSLYFRKADWLAHQAPAALLLAGDSTGQQGLDARLLGEAAGVRALNAGFPSGSPIVTRALLDAAPRPQRVLMALSPLLLSDRWPAELHEIEAATPSERVALIGAGPGLLDSLWATYRHRHLLRAVSKAEALHLLGRALPPGEVRDFGTMRGAALREDDTGSLPVAAPPEVGPGPSERLWQEWTARKAPLFGARLQALHGLAARWRREGVQVVYVLMPLHSALRAVIARAAEGRAQDLALWEVVRLHGGRVLDCRASVPDEGFYDPDHLRAGPLRDAFSRALGAALSRGDAACPRLAGGDDG